MTSSEIMLTTEKSTQYLRIQLDAVAAYADALQSQLTPLEERYRQAVAKLTEVQQGYLQELGRRITVAYQNYLETVNAIPAGNARLEQAVEAYNALAQRYAEYADPTRWASIAAPAQKNFQEAVLEALKGETAAEDMRVAVETFYRELNEALRHDHIVEDLSDAESHYVAQIGALHAEMERDWQNAIQAVNDSIAQATSETAAAFDINAALENFAGEVREVGEAMAEAHSAASEKATKIWEGGQPDSGGSSRSASTRPSAAPLAKPAPKPAATAPRDETRAARPSAVATPAMPRASWVNVPDPASTESVKAPEEWADTAKADENRKPSSGDAESKATAPQPAAKSSASGKPASAGKTVSAPSQRTDKTKDD